jgi:hypothetical protein
MTKLIFLTIIWNLFLKAVSIYLFLAVVIALITVVDCTVKEKESCSTELPLLGIYIEVNKT